MVAANPRGRNAAPADRLLAWYDAHARLLPWRARPGVRADPYAVWLSEIMLQQTTVKAVEPYFRKFLARWPRVADLAAAPTEAVMSAWAGLGYYSRARNLHACAKIVAADHGGRFPQTEAALRALPGLGPYTAAAVAAIAFGQRAVVVDGNVERVVARLFRIEAPLPGAKAEIRVRTDALTPDRRAGDFAQAMMDLGATICTPKRPACVLCPLRPDCAASAAGDAGSFPRRAAKSERPSRAGAVFVIRRVDGHVLLRVRPPKGLLGGMSEFPGTEWRTDFDAQGASPPMPLRFESAPGAVTHVFTHFALKLTVHVAQAPAGARAPDGMRWVAIDDLENEALPGLMRKVWRHADAALKRHDIRA